MCDSADSNWAWTLRDRQTGQSITNAEGYAYYFTDETQARRVADSLAPRPVDPIAMRDPGF
ncbi:MAG: hypothetical protein EPO26_02760 [Chloroflexota bacterium]|nr:MAG: hypothetical protein EPO26_02760 [Chloroflexota bacterium]